MKDHVLVRAALRAVQSLAAHVAQPPGHVPEELERHSSHDLLKAAAIARCLRDGDRVLDVGCGDGRRLEAVSMFRRIEPTGLEIQPEATRHARIDVRTFDGTSLPFEDGAFDVVMFCYVLHHLDVEHARRMLAEARRVARREVLLLEDSCETWSLPYRIRNFMHRLESDLEYGSAARDYRSPGGERMFLTHDGWRAFARDLGFPPPRVVPLASISKLAHHTMIQLPVAA